MWKLAAVLGLCSLSLLTACHSPSPSTHNRIDVATDDGMGSLDVLTLAHQVGPELLNSSLLSENDAPLTIAVSPIRNRDGIDFDANLFLRRLRLELNKQAQGKLHFVAQSKDQRALREQVRTDGNSARIQQLLDGVAKEIAELPELKDGAVIAMLPSMQVNFVNLNAESYLASLRSKVAGASGRKCRFLLPGKLEGAEYYLSGMFIADSDKTEGMVNLADWIKDLEQAEREGKSVVERIAVDEGETRVRSGALTQDRSTTRKRYVLRSRMQHEAQTDTKLRETPKVAKFLNVILVDAKGKYSIYEKQLNIENISSGYGNADYILAAEISDINKVEAGTQYVLVTIQLIDPIENVIVWETGYEVKFTK